MMKPTQPTLVCAICHTPIRITRRGWAHVSPLAKFGHAPVVLEPETGSAAQTAQEIQG